VLILALLAIGTVVALKHFDVFSTTVEVVL
jgi:hypothetical protein